MISLKRRAPAMNSFTKRASAHGSRLRHGDAAAKRSGSAQRAGRFRVRRVQSDPAVWRDLKWRAAHGLLAGEIPQEIYGRALVGNFEPLSPMV